MQRDKEERVNVGDEASMGRPRPEQQPPYISPMQPLTKEGYGGGFYGKDDEPAQNKNNNNQSSKRPAVAASKTQSADGPEEATVQPKHQPPPSTGDRDLDITGQSYIQ
nr:Mediator of RNA polymerase II transcription subunit 26 [Ipomoea batatas]